MTRIISLRALFVFPLALVFMMAVPSARAQTPIDILNGILKGYAADEGATTAATGSRNTLTASADDLVAAVYDALLHRPTLTDQEAADLAAAAVKSPDGSKARADKDKVAARILEAAILARGAQSNSGQVDKLLTTIGTVNSTLIPSKQLTAAGKEALIGKAIRATNGLGVTIATRSNALATAAAGTTDNLKRKTFTVAVLKTLVFKPQTYDPALASTTQATETTKGPHVQLNNGVPEPTIGLPFYDNNGVPPSVAGVRDYIDSLLDLYSPTLADKSAEALLIAEGVATLPSVAGAVIGGLIQDQKTAGASDTIVQATIVKAISDAKLAAAIADIVDNGLSQYTVNDKVAAATAIATGTTAVNKGKIASGAVRAVPGSAATIINNILGINETVASKNVSQTGLGAFATAAATGNGDPGTAAAISTAVINKVAVKTTPAADLTAIQTIALNVIKAVAPANPNSAFEVAQALFSVQRNGTNYYSATAANGGTAARNKLAADLAKGAATNYTAAGAAVAGVVAKAISLDPVTPGLDVSISAAAIKVAAKASLSIAQKVSLNRNYSGATAQAFASNLALLSLSTNAGAIAAGVSLTDTNHAGDIVKAVITSNGSATQNAALNKAAATIANTVAINLDVEAIADIGQKVASLYQPKTGFTNANLPKLATLGALATSLAKAINTKPLVLQSNRFDEFGELAAVLTTASLNIAGGNTAAALAAIGTNIYKAASAKLLANAGNNAVDLKDIAGDVAGAIAQVIALTPVSTTSGPGFLTQVEKDTLLSATGTGSLIKLLVTGAKTFGGQVFSTAVAAPGAFNRVFATRNSGGGYSIVGGAEAIGTNGVATTTGQFEIGAVIDGETRIKNL